MNPNEHSFGFIFSLYAIKKIYLCTKEITMNDQTVICAIATAPGMGAIAVIRLSGKGCIEICDRIFVSPSHKKLVDVLPNTIHFGKIVNKEELIDEVLISVFHAPHSFTGENSIEISCHGSVYIQQRILQLLISSGVRLAAPGEFTQRAFLNGKMDLSQAEAVADLIASSSATAHKMALSQMRGGFSDELMKLRMELLHITSLLELELDFSEEDVVQVAENTYYINAPSKIGVYRVSDDDVWLIDSGNDKDAGRKIQKILDAQGWKLTAIINTHSNADHDGGNTLLQNRLNCAVYTTPMELAIVEHPMLEPSFLYGGYPFKKLRNKFLMATPSKGQDIADAPLPAGMEYFRLPGHFWDMIGVKTPDDVYFMADLLHREHK